MNEAPNDKHKESIRVGRRIVLCAVCVLTGQGIENITNSHQISEKDGEKENAHGGTPGMMISTSSNIHNHGANGKSTWKAI